MPDDGSSPPPARTDSAHPSAPKTGTGPVVPKVTLLPRSGALPRPATGAVGTAPSAPMQRPRTGSIRLTLGTAPVPPGAGKTGTPGAPPVPAPPLRPSQAKTAPKLPGGFNRPPTAQLRLTTEPAPARPPTRALPPLPKTGSGGLVGNNISQMLASTRPPTAPLPSSGKITRPGLAPTPAVPNRPAPAPVVPAASSGFPAPAVPVTSNTGALLTGSDGASPVPVAPLPPLARKSAPVYIPLTKPAAPSGPAASGGVRPPTASLRLTPAPAPIAGRKTTPVYVPAARPADEQRAGGTPPLGGSQPRTATGSLRPPTASLRLTPAPDAARRSGPVVIPLTRAPQQPLAAPPAPTFQAPVAPAASAPTPASSTGSFLTGSTVLPSREPATSAPQRPATSPLPPTVPTPSGTPPRPASTTPAAKPAEEPTARLMPPPTLPSREAAPPAKPAAVTPARPTAPSIGSTPPTRLAPPVTGAKATSASQRLAVTLRASPPLPVPAGAPTPSPAQPPTERLQAAPLPAASTPPRQPPPSQPPVVPTPQPSAPAAPSRTSTDAVGPSVPVAEAKPAPSPGKPALPAAEGKSPASPLNAAAPAPTASASAPAKPASSALRAPEVPPAGTKPAGVPPTSSTPAPAPLAAPSAGKKTEAPSASAALAAAASAVAGAAAAVVGAASKPTESSSAATPAEIKPAPTKSEAPPPPSPAKTGAPIVSPPATATPPAKPASVSVVPPLAGSPGKSSTPLAGRPALTPPTGTVPPTSPAETSAGPVTPEPVIPARSAQAPPKRLTSHVVIAPVMGTSMATKPAEVAPPASPSAPISPGIPLSVAGAKAIAPAPAPVVPAGPTVPAAPSVPAKTAAAAPEKPAGNVPAPTTAAKSAEGPPKPKKSSAPLQAAPVAPAASAAAPVTAPPAALRAAADEKKPVAPAAKDASVAANLAAAAVSLTAAATAVHAAEKAKAESAPIERSPTPPPQKPGSDKKAAPQTKTAPATAPIPPREEPVRTAAALAPRRGYGWIVWLVILLLAAAAGVLIYTHYFNKGPSTAATNGTGTGAHAHRGADQARVVTAVAATADIPVYVTGLGAVTPLNTVTVQSRVAGQLMQVLFTEGQMVKKNDPLLLIDPRPYQAQLEQYVAQKEHDQAVLDNAVVDLQRYQALWAQDSIPQQTLATQEATVKQDKATVDTDQALIDQTQLNITYCNITSPIDGRVGLRLVDVGNYIQTTSTTGLLVITQIQPITVIFTIPEDSIDGVVTAMHSGQALPVDAYSRGGYAQKLATGTLLTIDNQIDPTTGTVKLRATFPNLDNALFPNQFVNTRMQVDTRRQVVTVPVAAVQHGTNNNTFVYLLNTDTSTVKLQNVQTGAVSFDGMTEEIKSGVQAGDTVVTDGVDKLSDGAKVVVAKPQDKNAAAGEAGAGSGNSSGTGDGQQHHHKKKPSSGDTNAAPAS